MRPFKKTYLLPCMTVAFIMICGAAFAYKFDFTTVNDVVTSVRKEFAKIQSYQAEFKIVTDGQGKGKLQTGIIKYKSANKLCVEFSQPAGQRIVSDGKTMWIYIPSLHVVAEQDLKSDTGLFSSNTKSGLSRLFSKYHYRFASKEQPEPQDDGSKMYTIILKQKESRSGYRRMKLWITEKYFITRAVGETSTGKRIDISFSNLKTNVNIPNATFRFEAPSSARVIKNPMISEE